MACLHDAGSGAGDGNAVVLEDRAGGAPHLNARLLVGGFSRDQRRFGQGQIVLGSEGLLVRSRAQFLFLLHDIEAPSRQIARLAGRIHAAGSLLKSITRIAHFDADALLQLLQIDLRLPVFQLGTVLIGLGDAVAQRNV